MTIKRKKNQSGRNILLYQQKIDLNDHMNFGNLQSKDFHVVLIDVINNNSFMMILCDALL